MQFNSGARFGIFSRQIDEGYGGAGFFLCGLEFPSIVHAHEFAQVFFRDFQGRHQILGMPWSSHMLNVFEMRPERRTNPRFVATSQVVMRVRSALRDLFNGVPFFKGV